MTLSSLSPTTHFLLLHSNAFFFSQTELLRLMARDPRTGSNRVVVLLSTHTNQRVLKSNRRSKSGQPLSLYDSDEDDEDDDGDEDEEEEYDDDDDDVYFAGDDWFSDNDFAESADFEAKKRKSKSTKGLEKKKLQTEVQLSVTVERAPNGKNRKRSLEKGPNGSHSYKGKLTSRRLMEEKYPRLADEIMLDEKWFPLMDYLSTFGLKDSHFVQMYERHSTSLQINMCSAKERLEYLISVGVKPRDVKRILLRQPQILEYTVENNLKSHVAFLTNLGIPSSRIGQIIASTPSLFSYSVENSLKPTIRYLVEEVGIKEKDLGKVVQLSPQILVQRIDISWNTRYLFLSNEIGAPRDNIVKMVTKHPQLLHYSIDDGLLPRINFLRSIGMRDADILKVLTSLTQVLSLSLEDNLKPKYLYLVNELNNEVHSLTKYPTYLSLSLDQRIRPRHRFLVSLKKAPKGPFPLSLFVPTDESFCQNCAGTSVDKYLAFRQSLLLNEFANKYERKH